METAYKPHRNFIDAPQHATPPLHHTQHNCIRFASPPTLPRDPRRGGWQGKGPDGRGRGGQGAKGQGARRVGDREQGTESNEAGRRLGGGWQLKKNVQFCY